jgi:prepilin peptidase CpaA
MGWDFLSLALPALLGLLLLSAGIEDARRRNIANWKNAAIASLAPLWWIAIGLDPWPGMAVQLGVAAVVFAAFAGAFALGQMGGGDVKLIGALALWLTPYNVVALIVAMSLAGGVLTILFLIDHKVRRPGGPIEVPYGVAIAVAGLLALREPLINQFA